MKKKKINYSVILAIMVIMTSLILFVFHLAWGYNNSEGRVYIVYNSKYPFILLSAYILIAVLLQPFILKKKADQELKLHFIPLMLFASLGMMRIDSEIAITSTNADYSPAIMFIILLLTLIIMTLSGHSLPGVAGTAAGTALYPAFGICFSPFIVTAAFLFDKESKKEHSVSVIANSVASLAAIVFSVTKLSFNEFSFERKYISVILLSVILLIVMIIKKEYSLIPVSVIPLFPLAAGILFKSFPTPIFTLSASIAPLVILLGTIVLTERNKKIQDYAQKLMHNPVLYVIVTIFILYTAGLRYVNPGILRDIYT